VAVVKTTISKNCIPELDRLGLDGAAPEPAVRPGVERNAILDLGAACAHVIFDQAPHGAELAQRVKVAGDSHVGVGDRVGPSRRRADVPGCASVFRSNTASLTSAADKADAPAIAAPGRIFSTCAAAQNLETIDRRLAAAGTTTRKVA
jgi:hypothetical protein